MAAKLLFVCYLIFSNVACNGVPPELEAIMKELSWMTKLKLLNEYSREINLPKLYRRALYDNRRSPPPTDVATVHHVEQEQPITGDEDNMKMKLFRLMYETVSDSDIKVKRAELIRSHYSNDSLFEIGYLMGDVTDKYNVMSDITSTLKRLYGDWKPIEHINAYEQIASQAIEIGHVIDIMRSVYKKRNMDHSPKVKA